MPLITLASQSSNITSLQPCLALQPYLSSPCLLVIQDDDSDNTDNTPTMPHTLQPCLTSPPPLSPPTSHHSNNTSTRQPCLTLQPCLSSPCLSVIQHDDSDNTPTMPHLQPCLTHSPTMPHITPTSHPPT